MELARELFATALLAVIFSFIIAKLVSLATTGPSQSVSTGDIDRELVRDVKDEEDVIMEELQFHQKFEVETLVGENRTESVEMVAGKLDEFAAGEIESECRESPVESVEELVNEEKKKEVEEIAIESVVENDVVERVGEKSEEKNEVVIESDEDWEGIERSELEKVFALAVKFVECGDKSEKLAGDVEMELYGLNKVATEGPCREQAPMALKVSARAKWNTWQKLGNLSPEVAMEQYIAIVSDRVPGWMENKSTGDDNLGSSEAADHGAVSSDLCTSSSRQPEIIDERDAEMKSADKELM